MMREPPHPPSTVQIDTGRRARKAAAARRALFEAGLEAFDRQPIGLVSVLDITEAADVAKGVFYLHFRSKDDYLLSLLSEVHHEALEAIRADVAQLRSRRTRWEAAVDALLRLAADNERAVRFWNRMAGFLEDEVGEPGQLTAVRWSFIDYLATLLAGVTSQPITDRDRLEAVILDRTVRAMIDGRARGEIKLDSPGVRQIVLAAIRAAAGR